MVMLVVNYAAVAFSLLNQPPVSEIVTQSTQGGATDYFFTDSVIYAATMFALQNEDGSWPGNLFFGRTSIGANGAVGFVPDAEIMGTVNGVPADQVAVQYVTDHGTNAGINDALFSGDDTLIGNMRGDVLAGGDGNDFIVGGGAYLSPRPNLNGGAGNDVIHAEGGALVQANVYGGSGQDFIYIGDCSVTATGDRVDKDTFYFHSESSQFTEGFITDFSVREILQFSPTTFTSLASGFSAQNFYVGSSAHDANDFVVLSGHTLYYDPDGNGPGQAFAVAYFKKILPSARNIVVSDDVPAAGDAAHPSAVPTHHDFGAMSFHPMDGHLPLHLAPMFVV